MTNYQHWALGSITHRRRFRMGVSDVSRAYCLGVRARYRQMMLAGVWPLSEPHVVTPGGSDGEPTAPPAAGRTNDHPA